MSAAIMWVDQNSKFRRPAKRWNPETGKLETVVDDLGRQAFERVPQTGREGRVLDVEDIKSTQPMKLPRSIAVLRDDGHETHAVIRNAAASGFGDKGTDTSYLRYVQAKGAHLGWLPETACPVDLVLRRERNVLQLISPDVRKAVEARDACPHGTTGAGRPPCKHYFQERAARQARRAGENAALQEQNKSPQERTAEALADLVKRGASVQQVAPVVAPAASEEFAPQKKGPK